MDYSLLVEPSKKIDTTSKVEINHTDLQPDYGSHVSLLDKYKYESSNVNENKDHSFTNEPNKKKDFSSETSYIYSHTIQERINPRAADFMEGMLKFFFQEQMNVINQYKEYIDKISEERDKAVYDSMASKQKLIALEQLKSEQEKVKDNLGFYPFDCNYNEKVEAMLNCMIENRSRTKGSKRSSINDIRAGGIIISPTDNKLINDNKEIDLIDTYKGDTGNNDIPLNFKSKYENSMTSMNFRYEEEVDENAEPKSLKGTSRFVKVNEAQLTQMESWREENYSKPTFPLNVHDSRIEENLFTASEKILNQRLKQIQENSFTFLGSSIINKIPSENKGIVEDKDKCVIIEAKEINSYPETNKFNKDDTPDEQYNDFCNYSEEETYGDENFYRDNELENINEKDINLEDFREIHETNAYKTRINFYDNQEKEQKEIKLLTITNREEKTDDKHPESDPIKTQIDLHNEEYLESVNHFNENFDFAKLVESQLKEELSPMRKRLNRNNTTPLDNESRISEYNPLLDYNILYDLNRFKQFALSQKPKRCVTEKKRYCNERLTNLSLERSNTAKQDYNKSPLNKNLFSLPKIK